MSRRRYVLTLRLDAKGNTIADWNEDMDKLKLIELLSEISKLIYDLAIAEIADKRKMEQTELDRLVKLIQKQKKPKEN